MLGTFLEKVGGLFDRRFIVAYWSPLFIGFGLAGGLVVVARGLPVVFGWWVKLSVEEHVVLGVGSLLAVTLLAYVLDALTVPLVRFYEGYWPWRWLTDLMTRWQKTQKARRPTSAKPYEVPRDPALLKPTRLVLQCHLARGIRHEMAFQAPSSTKALREAMSLWSHLTF